MVEGTGVSENGRLGPNGLGLWKEEQLDSIKTIVDFTHSQVWKRPQYPNLFECFISCAPTRPRALSFSDLILESLIPRQLLTL